MNLSLTDDSVSDRLKVNDPLGKRPEETTMKRKPHDSVTAEIVAPPERVYALVSDITRWASGAERIKCSWARVPPARRSGRGSGPETGWPGADLVQHSGRHRGEPGRGLRSTAAGQASAPQLAVRLEPTPTGTRVTESYDAERPLGGFMNWLTMKWTGSGPRRGPSRRHDHDPCAGQGSSRGRLTVRRSPGSEG